MLPSKRENQEFSGEGGVEMAHRANFVIIQNGHANAYYDKWAALNCINLFARGPEEARGMEGFERTNELIDFHFAEGGYLIDFDEKKAIVYGHTADVGGSEDKPSDDPNSPFVQGGLAYLQHIGPNWAGWKLVWDARVVDAFAAHLRSRNITDIAVQRDMHGPKTPGPIEHQA